MNDAEAAARGTRAKAYRDEFLGPSIDQQRDAYSKRIIEIASTELDPRTRNDKLTALSFALRVLDNVASGIDAAIRDGEIAEGNLMKADRIERMTPEKRRLLQFAPR
jgi:hypothetical protein